MGNTRRKRQLDSLTVLVELLGRERSFTHPGCVSFHHTINVSDALRRNTKTSQNSTDTGVGRGDVWVSTEVDVQHQSVGTLNQNLLLFLESLVHELDRVHNKWLDLFSELLVLGELSLDVAVKLTVSLETGVDKSSDSGLELFPGVWLVRNQVVDSHTGSGGLGGISWSNTLTGGSNGLLVAGKLGLSKFVHTLVEVENQVSSRRQEQTTFTVESLLLDFVQLLEERWKMNNNTGSNQVDTLWIHQSRRKHVEIVLLVSHNNGVSGVVTTLTSGTHLDVVTKKIDKFSFTFVTPLGT
ncbi:hypothetical protein OGAPHI_004106 [Ogataea philodendri]|uniref:Uncharacterized protein n=1 Tax=Ogataea philodendri TaxID=1378263 RepID=A0A9P8P607_9ASCO|nr:uncharacterized protein OGAPHI_004106 [Ogataea philodendri]KAH3665917.1 hypothetical protein OGAPHI_004106 [Ogataea philodendri]